MAKPAGDVKDAAAPLAPVAPDALDKPKQPAAKPVVGHHVKSPDAMIGAVQLESMLLWLDSVSTSEWLSMINGFDAHHVIKVSNRPTLCTKLAAVVEHIRPVDHKQHAHGPIKLGKAVAAALDNPPKKPSQNWNKLFEVTESEAKRFSMDEKDMKGASDDMTKSILNRIKPIIGDLWAQYDVNNDETLDELELTLLLRDITREIKEIFPALLTRELRARGVSEKDLKNDPAIVKYQTTHAAEVAKNLASIKLSDLAGAFDANNDGKIVKEEFFQAVPNVFFAAFMSATAISL